MTKNDKITVMNFSGIYYREKYFRKRNCTFVECTDLKGTNCYCDNETLKTITERIADFSVSNIHFIDSGNFHYMSKLWMDKISFPFDLVLLDHHTDIQSSLIEGMLSCGNWVKIALDTNSFLHNVIMIGVDDSLIPSIDPKYADRLFFYSEQTLNHEEAWNSFSSLNIKYPIYISIDKDVLSTKDTITSWDQGSMTLPQLESILQYIFKNEKVIGIDICGESDDAPLINEKVNKTILQWIRRYDKL